MQNSQIQKKITVDFLILNFIYFFLSFPEQIQKKKTVVFTLSDGRWDLDSINLL